MSETQLLELLQGLKSTDKEKVSNSLVKIRSSVITDSKGIERFRTSGGLKLLVCLLKCPNQKNLDLALSILGNCCLQESCSLAVGQLKISELLVNLIQNIAKDSVLCRACRLLGNLSVHKVNAESFHSAGAVWALVGILKNHLEHEDEAKDNVASLGTIAMAVRALGILWNKEYCRDDMLSVGAAKIIISILVHRDIRNNIEKLEFTNVILKALVSITTLDRSENSLAITDYLATQICYDTKAIDVIANIIDKESEPAESNDKLNKQIKQNSKLALTILYNLCSIHQCRDQLGKSKALPILMTKVDTEEGFKSLILLCRDKRVHAKARSSGALRALLASIKKSESKTKISLVLDVLRQYILDKCIIFELVNEGLINILIMVISNYVRDMDCSSKPIKNCKHTCSGHPNCNETGKKDIKEEDSKSKRPSEMKCDSSFKKLLIDGENAQFTYYLSSIPSSPHNSRALWSPQSDSTGYGSMDATPPRRDSVASEDFESYSPVCSDNEGDGENQNDEEIDMDDQHTEDQDRNNELDELYDDQENYVSDTEDSTETSDEIETKDDYYHDIYICVRLLQQVTFYECIVPQLAQAETILPLFKFIVYSSQGLSNAVYALHEILGRVEYLKTILKTDLVVQMYKTINKNTSECKQCIKAKDRVSKLRTQLQTVAESPCGVGEIENILCLGSAELKRKYILDTALLVDSVIVLKRVLFKFGTMEVLMKLLTDGKYKKSAMIALINYAKILKREDPTKEIFFKNKSSESIKSSIVSEDTVTFILKDGFKIYFDKAILIEKSDVFRIMLDSDFIENTGVIHLNDVAKDSLLYFLDLLHLDIKNIKLIAPPLPKNVNIATEALMLTDKYLLPELNTLLCKIILQFILKPENVYEMYEQCLCLKIDNLKLECISYILSNSVARKKICNLFETANESDVFDHFITDIKELLQMR